MSDIHLFRIAGGKAQELQGDASDLERPLQNLIEANLESLLGIRYLATEYSTGKTHGGRIDTLGIDENSCPVILEYKRSVGENVINQGLFYLDWLMDHQAEFKLLTLEKFGKSAADSIDWSAPRLVCIAADFTKYDGHAVQQINRNIELIRYRRFGDDLLLFELANASATASSKPTATKTAKAAANKQPADTDTTSRDKPFDDVVATMSPTLVEVLTSLQDHMLSLGDDVQTKQLRLYVAFKRIRNFASVVAQKGRLLLNLHIDPVAVTRVIPTARDVRQIGHWGTGDVEIPLQSLDDLAAVKPFIANAYEGRAPALPEIPA